MEQVEKPLYLVSEDKSSRTKNDYFEDRFDVKDIDSYVARSLIPGSLLGLEHILNQRSIHHRFEIDCAVMLPHSAYDRVKGNNGNVLDLFKKLIRIKTPIIYWFEFDDSVNVPQQMARFEKYRKRQGRLSKKEKRVVPLPNGCGTGTILYVGKRQGGANSRTGFTYAADRIEMHLGYNSNGANQGLQLCHWSDAKITLNVLELPSSAERYLTALEHLFAVELSPWLGKH